MTPLRERFSTKYTVDPSGCWVWTGSRDAQGYGHVCRGRREEGVALAHRVSYELHIGPIPDGLHIDHLCRNRACVNPDHLEAVTPAENVRRSFDHPRKPPELNTHCPNGHEFTPENTRTPPSGGRKCIECARATLRRFRANHPNYDRDYDKAHRPDRR